MVVSNPVELLTITEVSARLKCSRETVLNWIKSGRLPALDIGGRRMGYRVRADDLERFIHENYFVMDDND